jgi:glycosyltransferase involved in cell wall biosynthesis
VGHKDDALGFLTRGLEFPVVAVNGSFKIDLRQIMTTPAGLPRLKIGLLHDSVLPPKTYGGIERIVVNLMREYKRRGHEVVVFCRKESRLDDVETIALPEGYNGEDISSLIPSDLSFLHSHQPLRFEPKVPHLVTIHGNGSPEEKYLRNTNFLSKSHARNHNAKYFVYNGVDPTLYPYTEKKQDYLVFLARTTWRVKNLKTAIHVAQETGCRLEIMGGTGVSRGLLNYRGLVDEPEKVEVLRNAKALIYPTNWDEPCAAAPLEALACGTPVLTSENGCMPELVRPGTGFACGSYASLVAAVGELPRIQPRACRDSIEGFFSLGRMTDDYLKLFERILVHGPLDHEPRYNFSKDSVHWIYKPVWTNRLRLAVTGKV